MIIIQKKTISSTNNEALELTNSSKKPEFGTMIIAEEQTKGRGRYQRKWVSNKGNLFCSIILNYKNCFEQINQISFASSIAILKTLEKFGVENISLKWPNDVLVNGKKISGVLIETNGKADGSMIVGIGVNLIHYPKEQIHYSATSLLNETNKKVAPIDFAITLRENLIKYSELSNINEEWFKYAANKNKPITVNLKDKTIKGIFTTIDEQGHLILINDKQEKIKISSGDVFLND
ncbi:MAG: biotin--[acetyl-CoA-carboxylase] ligase [Alphaproteobacteria bacterium]|jgi:BirA family biotin operon repressor/biotin-[acetyl-CoA-carboxylase] ligase|nr:biotin--[acetyl-CoA-carboxylase] ligase [Alphaproteobacteria bacterium]